MALLQISEPGGAPDPHQRRIAIGIDLGTTHSLVAAVRNGVAECLPDDAGRVILPSAVRYLSDDKRQIGATALAEAALDPRNTIVSVKRFMGRGLADIEGRDKLPYEFVDAPGPLHGQALRASALRGEAIGVHLGLQVAAAGVELGSVQPLPRRQAEQGQVIVAELHKALP